MPIQNDIAWLHIAVDKPTLVSVVQGRAHLLANSERLVYTQGTLAGDQSGQAGAGQIGHDDEVLTLVLANLVDGHDVGVGQTGHGPGLPPEAIQEGPVAQK